MSPTQQAERAAFNYLASFTLTGIPSAQIYRGFYNAAAADSVAIPETKIHPSATVNMDDASEFVRYTGNLVGVLDVIVEAPASDYSDQDFQTIADEVFLKFQQSDLAAQFTDSLTNFHCFSARPSNPAKTIKQGENWVAILPVEMHFCCSDL